MNCLPLLNFYEVLRIDGNDYVENENDGATERTITSESNKKKILKRTNQ